MSSGRAPHCRRGRAPAVRWQSSSPRSMSGWEVVSEAAAREHSLLAAQRLETGHESPRSASIAGGSPACGQDRAERHSRISAIALRESRGQTGAVGQLTDQRYTGVGDKPSASRSLHHRVDTIGTCSRVSNSWRWTAGIPRVMRDQRLIQRTRKRPLRRSTAGGAGQRACAMAQTTAGSSRSFRRLCHGRCAFQRPKLATTARRLPQLRTHSGRRP